MGRASGEGKEQTATPAWARPLSPKEKEILSTLSLKARLAATAKFDVLVAQVTDVLMQAESGTPEKTLQELRHLRTALDQVDSVLDHYLSARADAHKVISNLLGRRR